MLFIWHCGSEQPSLLLSFRLGLSEYAPFDIGPDPIFVANKCPERSACSEKPARSVQLFIAFLYKVQLRRFNFIESTFPKFDAYASYREMVRRDLPKVMSLSHDNMANIIFFLGVELRDEDIMRFILSQPPQRGAEKDGRSSGITRWTYGQIIFDQLDPGAEGISRARAWNRHDEANSRGYTIME